MQVDGTLFQLLVVFAFTFCALMLLVKRRAVESSEQKWFFLGLVGFFIGWALCELFFYASAKVDPSFYLALYKGAYIAGICGILSLLLVVEKFAVPKTKFIFTIITLVGLALVIIFPMPATDEIIGARLAAYIFLPAGVASILLLYLYMVFKLTDELRRETIMILLGFILIFAGYVLTTSLFADFYEATPYWSVICYSLMIAGGFILTLTYYKKEI